MKNIYTTPHLEVVKIAEDVITTSGILGLDDVIPGESAGSGEEEA